jgi:hypothetical protein
VRRCDLLTTSAPEVDIVAEWQCRYRCDPFFDVEDGCGDVRFSVLVLLEVMLFDASMSPDLIQEVVHLQLHW